MSDSKVNENQGAQKNTFILYTTSGCHLCEDALSILDDLHQQMLNVALSEAFPIQDGSLFAIEAFDIASDDALIESFGQRIPVLMFNEQDAELAWPFDIQQAYEFIAPKLVF